MKTILIMLSLLAAQIVSAQSTPYINDLDSIPLTLQESSTPVYQVNYPGLGPAGRIRDCLIVDVVQTEHFISINQKMAFANRISVRDGFMFGERIGTELKPRVQGNSIVFPLRSVGLYMTHIQANGRNGKTLLKVIEETLLPAEDSTSPILVNLLYVRGCRL